MGQQKSSQKQFDPLINKMFYELDMRLLQKVQDYASTFPADIEQIILEAEQFYIKEPDHFLSEFFISQINDRFNSLIINQEAAQNATNSKTILQIFHINPTFLNHKFWYQLESKEKFLNFLDKTEEKFWIEYELYKILQPNKGMDFEITKQSVQISIRKPIKGNYGLASYGSQLRQPLFKKLFFYFYHQLVRTFCQSKNGIDRANTISYHTTIGHNILRIVSADYISEEKLFELFYNTVKIDKTSRQLADLQQISAEYQIYCLKHQHTISINKNKLEKIKIFSKCYLDQLYFLAIKEAEDPEILEDSMSDGLMLKNFPINRVKERNRNM